MLGSRALVFVFVYVSFRSLPGPSICTASDGLACFVPDLLKAIVGKMGLAQSRVEGWEESSRKVPQRQSLCFQGLMVAGPFFGQIRK